MQDHIGGNYVFERGTERRHKHGRQIRDETHRVGENDIGPMGQLHHARGRIQRGKQKVLGHDIGRRQPIEQRRFTGIGITDQCHHWVRHFAAAFTVQPARALHLFEIFLDAHHAFLNDTPIRFDLRFTRTTQKAEAAALAFEMGP